MERFVRYDPLQAHDDSASSPSPSPSQQPSPPSSPPPPPPSDETIPSAPVPPSHLLVEGPDGSLSWGVDLEKEQQQQQQQQQQHQEEEQQQQQDAEELQQYLQTAMVSEIEMEDSAYQPTLWIAAPQLAAHEQRMRMFLAMVSIEIAYSIVLFCAPLYLTGGYLDTSVRQQGLALISIVVDIIGILAVHRHSLSLLTSFTLAEALLLGASLAQPTTPIAIVFRLIILLAALQVRTSFYMAQTTLPLVPMTVSW